MFCCFTGLSYSDVKTLTPEHFETDEDGRVWIKKKRVKTGVLFRVPQEVAELCELYDVEES